MRNVNYKSKGSQTVKKNNSECNNSNVNNRTKKKKSKNCQNDNSKRNVNYSSPAKYCRSLRLFKQKYAVHHKARCDFDINLEDFGSFIAGKAQKYQKHSTAVAVFGNRIWYGYHMGDSTNNLRHDTNNIAKAEEIAKKHLQSVLKDYKTCLAKRKQTQQALENKRRREEEKQRRLINIRRNSERGKRMKKTEAKEQKEQDKQKQLQQRESVKRKAKDRREAQQQQLQFGDKSDQRSTDINNELDKLCNENELLAQERMQLKREQFASELRNRENENKDRCNSNGVSTNANRQNRMNCFDLMSNMNNYENDRLVDSHIGSYSQASSRSMKTSHRDHGNGFNWNDSDTLTTRPLSMNRNSARARNSGPSQSSLSPMRSFDDRYKFTTMSCDRSMFGSTWYGSGLNNQAWQESNRRKKDKKKKMRKARFLSDHERSVCNNDNSNSNNSNNSNNNQNRLKHGKFVQPQREEPSRVEEQESPRDMYCIGCGLKGIGLCPPCYYKRETNSISLKFSSNSRNNSNNSNNSHDNNNNKSGDANEMALGGRRRIQRRRTNYDWNNGYGSDDDDDDCGNTRYVNTRMKKGSKSMKMQSERRMNSRSNDLKDSCFSGSRGYGIRNNSNYKRDMV